MKGGGLLGRSCRKPDPLDHSHASGDSYTATQASNWLVAGRPWIPAFTGMTEISTDHQCHSRADGNPVAPARPTAEGMQSIRAHPILEFISATPLPEGEETGDEGLFSEGPFIR